MPAPERPIVLIHGYSDTAEGFETWRQILRRGTARRRVASVHVGEWVSLTNEVSIKDIAEGLDRALLVQAGLGKGTEFDAIVHSTGMLVVRSWLTSHPARRERLKHLIALAPATYGSPLAHKGRSRLGSIFKGNRDPGPDFLEAGNEILYGLELGSRFTWDLAHQDLFSGKPFYGEDNTTPYVFIFCGNEAYRGLRKVVNEPGTDGTVRWAGCSLNTRKLVMDLTRDPGSGRVDLHQIVNVSDIPLIFIDGVNHGTIMKEPPAILQELVWSALDVDSMDELKAWCVNAERATERARAKVERWQQFVVRLVDERGDPITDYDVEIHGRRPGRPMARLDEFEEDVHKYQRDESLRNFHVNVGALLDLGLERLRVNLTASSGTKLVGYVGLGDDENGARLPEPTQEVSIDITPTLSDRKFDFFHPFTTTLVEIRMNREPLPLGEINKVYKFADRG